MFEITKLIQILMYSFINLCIPIYIKVHVFFKENIAWSIFFKKLFILKAPTLSQ